MLRLVSFGMDLHWARLNGVTEVHIRHHASVLLRANKLIKKGRRLECSVRQRTPNDLSP